jgi:hypothetical protein
VDVGRGIADIAVVRAEPDVDRQHDRHIGGAHDPGAGKIAPVRPKAEHGHVIRRVSDNDRVRGPEKPENDVTALQNAP